MGFRNGVGGQPGQRASNLQKMGYLFTMKPAVHMAAHDGLPASLTSIRRGVGF